MQQLFITGLHRSGTTLLEKLLHNHPQIAMASQPAPLLYYHVKQTFLAHTGLERLYPIDPQFPETGYRPGDFTGFLESYQLTSEEIRNMADKMSGYEAQYSPDLLPHLHELRPGNFAEVYKQICALTKWQSPEKQVLWQGTKEIIGEEFLPYLAASGVKCLLVIRDPRDMLLSTNSGKELGQVRPTLYYLRMWRKSVAYALELQEKNQALVLCYEDLVLKPDIVLQQIADYLLLPTFPEKMLQGPILGQQGGNWTGNSGFSSYDSLSTDPVGRYRQHFSAPQVRFIEAFCYPEMQLLGYTCEQIDKENYRPEFLQSQREPFTVTHRNFSPGYSHSTKHLQQEVKRCKFLLSNTQATVPEQQEFFIFESAFRKLRETIRQTSTSGTGY